MNVAIVDARTRARNVSACSFDVFDTFLLRACTTPDGVFERVYELARISELCPNVSTSFVQHRIQAEAHARKNAKQRRDSVEVHISDIYSYFPFRLFGLDRGALNVLAEAEFAAEIELCRANPDMVQKYLEMKRAGYRVGFISDTYWNSQQLARLLRACSPELSWDFLYASCDQDSGKGEKLFAKYLAEQGIDPASSIHFGDNEKADIAGARRHGIRPRYYPQASAAFASKLQRETAMFELLCPERPSRLDHGGRTLRRVVAAASSDKRPGFQLGLTVLGPIMAAFDAYIEARRAQLARAGRRVAIGFLGRDGFLPHRIWQDAHGEAAYLEINRRVSLLGSADTLEPLCDLLEKLGKIDEPSFAQMFTILPPPVKAFFAKCPDGVATGRDISRALPRLVDAGHVAQIAAGIRKRLLDYLRNTIPEFDSCTDLMLVDLGYSGSVQKGLRRIFDREGIATRLHGTYLLSLDDAFYDVAECDTAEGLVSDLVVTPHAKRMMLRNVALLEQICCAADGSVRDYRDGEVLREDNLCPADQLALAAEIQTGARTFAAQARALAPRYGLRPYAASDVMARWTAAILGRLLLLPDDDELVLFGNFSHDVNLGTRKMVPMLDSNTVKDQVIARGLPIACTAPEPPMWLAGSLASISSSHAYLYVLFGTNRLPPNVFGETPCGSLRIGLFGSNGRAAMEAITVFQSGLGELRLRIPIAQDMAVATIAVPLGKLARDGIMQGVVVQSGKDTAQAADNPDVVRVADDRLIFAGVARNGRHYRADDERGCLLIPVDPPRSKVAIYTISLTSLDCDRIVGVGKASRA
nr:HAD family hydrolase [Bradyrhizobium sp. ARR65]